jgi:16S rRNA (guanine527-N7)-methyltransferase
VGSRRNSKTEEQENVIHYRIAEWFPDLQPIQQDKIKIFFDEVLKFNKTINLVSAKAIFTMDLMHFADSILASRVISSSLKGDSVYDIGSGNGFPGIIFAILNPTIQVILVDSDQRKCEFLKHCITTLNIQNASVLNKKIEALPDGSIVNAMTRGFANIAKSILITRKVFKKGGVFFHLKSEEWASEVASIPTQLCSFWMPSLCSEYKLPVGPIKYAVVKTEKINE